MDVRCEKCKTEYEFDDARLTEAGITVRCTKCSHVFKVKRKVHVVTVPVKPEEAAREVAKAAAANAAAAAAAAAEKGREWRVKTAQGDSFSFKELTTLQKWIVERKVTREDQISLTGEQWKRLGDIAELASFFQVVEAADRAGQMGWQQPTASSPGFQVPWGQPGQPPPPGYPPQPGYPNPNYPMPAGYPVMPTPVAPAPAAPPPAPAQLPAPPPPPTTQTWAPSPSPRAAPDPDLGDLEDDLRALQRPSPARWIALGLVLALLAAAGGLWVFERPRVEGWLGIKRELPTQVREALAAAEAAARPDTDAGYVQAISEAEKALAGAGERPLPQAHTAIARFEAARARLYADRALDEEALAAGLPEAEADAKKSEANKARVDGAARLSAARQALEKAQAIDPKAPAVGVARAAIAEAGGDRAGLDQAVAAVGKSPAEKDPTLLLARGRALALDPATRTQAKAALEEALVAQGSFVAARMALARLATEEKRLPDARALVEKVLVDAPEHEGAKRLLQRLTPPPVAQVDAGVELDAGVAQDAGLEADAGVAQDAGVAPDAGIAPADAGVALVAAADAGAVKPPVAGWDETAPGAFEGALAKGNRLRESDKPAAALEWFERARVLEPQSAEPLAGKGLCQLDLGNEEAAIRFFREALTKNPRFASAWMGLGEAFRQKGDNAQALDAYQKYLELNPGGSEAPVARSWIEKLKATP